MKNLIYVFTALILVSIVACTGTIDIQKEEEAIKAVMEEEKDAYFNQDFNTISASWVQKPSSVKIFMIESGPTEYVGWEKISAGDKEALSQVVPNFKNMTVTFSDYVFDINNNNAWVMCKATWDGLYNDQQMHFEQKRIQTFEKDGGKWKFTLIAIYAIPQVDLEAEKTAVGSVLIDIEKAFETNDPELLSNIFSDNPDNIFFGTDAAERWVGFGSFIEAQKQFFVSVEKGSDITFRDVVIDIDNSGNTAWLSCLMDWKGKAQGVAFANEGLRMTTVLEKQDGKWVVVQMHGSVPVSGQAIIY
ncbi:nuclear transport factor 2 family protein [Candidatus Latescibacterota bacterium]